MGSIQATDPCGLILKLEKDALWTPHLGNNFVLGYFDRLTFQRVDRWFDFSPRTSAIRFDPKQSSSDVRGAGFPLSMYPIKMLFPSSNVMERLHERGLDYAFWMNDIAKQLDSFPCLTVVLINLTDAFKEKRVTHDTCDKQLEQLVKVLDGGLFYTLGGAAPFDKAKAEAAHLCIMPSLGYSDYCVLIAEKDWSFAPALIEYLHRATLNDKPVLSTDYVIPVYHIMEGTTGKSHPIQSQGHQAGMRMSMRIHLRPGVALGDVQQAVGSSLEVWQITGSSDCVLVSPKGQDFSQLMAMAMSGHKKGKKTIKNLVVSTEATIHNTVIGNSQSPSKHRLANPPSKNQKIDRLREVLQEYWFLLKKENQHMRLFGAVWEKITSIENICRQPHNWALQSVIEQWLDAFTYCFIQELKAMNEETESSQPNMFSGEIRQRIKYVQDVMEVFISEVGSYIADLSRSDCFFMETERYNHPSVSSATALLLAYNRWQNRFVVDVLKEEGAHRLSQYVFLVRCGGCDKTHTTDLFSGTEPTIKDLSGTKKKKREILIEKKPFITHMSEMALFDCSGAVLRMTHECMHYCGNRMRKERMHYVFVFTSRYLARLLAYAFFSYKDYVRHLLNQLETKFGLSEGRLARQVEDCWGENLHKLEEKIARAIEENLSRYYDAEKESWDERNYVSTNLKYWMLEKLSSQFLWYHRADAKEAKFYSRFVDVLYQCILVTARDFYDRCNWIIQCYNSRISFCAIEKRVIDSYLELWEHKNEYQDNETIRLIHAVLDQMLANPEIPLDDKTFESLQDDDLNITVEEVVFGNFGETFADVEACIRLGATLSDYLLAFAFEEWDIEKALPADLTFVYRLPPVICLCFPDSLQIQVEENGREQIRLTEKAVQELEKAVNKLNEHDMPESRLNYKALKTQTERLLQTYKDCCGWVAEPLEEYLKLCQDAYKKSKHIHMAPYQKAFAQIRLPDSDMGKDAIVHMFTSLTTIGEVDYGGREKSGTEV